MLKGLTERPFYCPWITSASIFLVPCLPRLGGRIANSVFRSYPHFYPHFKFCRAHIRPSRTIRSRDSANAGALRILPCMDTTEAPRPTSVAASAPPLAADDPRLTPEAIEHRRANGLVERDESGRLLPGSQLPNKGRKGGPMVTTLARQYTESAIDLLGKMVEDEKAPPAARVAAAQALLDRGWGKAPIQVDLNVKARFDDFLRDVGLAATYEHEHPDSEAALEGAGE